MGVKTYLGGLLVVVGLMLVFRTSMPEGVRTQFDSTFAIQQSTTDEEYAKLNP